MKNLFLFFTTIVISVFSSAQSVPIPSTHFPVRQNVGAVNVLTNTMGATQSSVGLILGNYTDTTQANLNPYIKYYAGALIRTAGEVLWIRNATATKWLRSVGGSNSTISLVNNNVLICDGTGVCDTIINITSIINPKSVYFSSDTTIVICDSLLNCQTMTIPKQQLYIFQNGTNSPSLGIAEFGGTLLHPTTLSAEYNYLNLDGRTVYDYPYRFQQLDDYQEGSGIASFKQRGWFKDSITTGTFVFNNTTLGINFTADTYTASLDSGYFGKNIGYFLGVNGTGNGAYGLRVEDQTSKLGGIFFHTNDTTFKDAVTIYGMARPNAVYVGGSRAAQPTLSQTQIASFKTNRQVKFHGYASSGFRVNDTTSYKPVTVDVNGDLWQSNWPVGGINNTNIGDGYRILKPVTQELKTLFAGTNVTIDSTTNANGLTISASGGTTYIDAGTNVSITGTGISTDHYVVNSTDSTANVRIDSLLSNFPTPNLQQVTDVGKVTTNNMVITTSGYTSGGNYAGMEFHNTVSASSWYIMNDNAGAFAIQNNGLGLQTFYAQPTGQIGFLQYGSGTFAGTAVYGLGVDASGNIVETGGTGGGGGAGSGTVTSVGATATGALSFSGSPVTSSGTLALGWTGDTTKYVRGDGSLATFPTTARDSLFGVLDNLAIADRTFSQGSGHKFTWGGTWTSTTYHMIEFSNTGTGATGVAGFLNNSTSETVAIINQGGGAGLTVDGTTGAGIFINVTTGLPLRVGNSTPSGYTSYVSPMLQIYRTTSGTAANGIGSSIDFNTQSSSGTSYLSNQITSKWTDATTASRTSQFVITGYNSATSQDVFFNYGNGDAETPVAGSGLILKSPDGTKRARISINNSGVLTTTAL